MKRVAYVDDPSESCHLTLRSFSLLFWVSADRKKGFNEVENTVEHLAAIQPIISLQEMVETNNRVTEDGMLSFGGHKK